MLVGEGGGEEGGWKGGEEGVGVRSFPRKNDIPPSLPTLNIERARLLSFGVGAEQPS